MTLRAAFIGSVAFSRTCLEIVANSPLVTLVAVLCPAPEDAKFNADYVDLAPVAERLGIPWRRIRRLSDPDLVTKVAEMRLDVLFVFGLSQLVPRQVFALPRLGSIGTHPSLLPQGRGRHPLIWALVQGLNETGLSFFWLDDGPDTGDILWQRRFEIDVDDDAAVLYSRIQHLAADGLNEFLPMLDRGIVPRQPQDHSKATVWRKRTEADGEIRWDRPAMEAHNLIRALTHPYPGAHTSWQGQELKLWRSRPPFAGNGEAPRVRPGTVIRRTSQGFAVQCSDLALDVVCVTSQRSTLPEVGNTLGTSQG